MLELLAVSSAVLIGYAYIGFPFICWLRAKLFPRPFATADITPNVSLVVACHNEEADLPSKLENILAIDYPQQKLEVIIASDGSDDRSVAIARGYEEHGIRVLDLPRRGKAQTLNSAIPEASGDILVLSDSNSLYEPQAIRQIVRPFADEKVGGVAGNQCYTKGDKASRHGAGQGEQSYWDVDRLLKVWQSQSGNTISATGAIYAIRSSLFQKIPDGVTDDFTTSTRVIAQGKRLVFAPESRSWEPVAASAKREFGRKVRVITRGLRAVWVMRELLDPTRYGFYALQLFSHKVLRRLMFVPLLTLLVSSLLLCSKYSVLIPFAGTQVVFYLLAGIGWLAQIKSVPLPKKLFLPFYFCLVNVACMVAVYNVLTGRKIVRWQTERAGCTQEITDASIG